MDSLKKQIRRQLQEKRRQLSPQAQAIAAKSIAYQLFNQGYFRQAQHIALYMPFAGEVDTRLILEKAFLSHKFCYLPVVTHHMQFVKVDNLASLSKNRFGILEPPFEANHVIEPSALDLVLLPLVAFDDFCHRLGMGGGFYDKTFHFKRRSHLKPYLVGLAYDFQHIEKIPRANLDVQLDEVITEKKIYSAT